MKYSIPFFNEVRQDKDTIKSKQLSTKNKNKKKTNNNNFLCARHCSKHFQNSYLAQLHWCMLLICCYLETGPHGRPGFDSQPYLNRQAQWCASIVLISCEDGARGS